MATSVAIIGGGIGGLTAAYRLASDGADVTLLESTDQLGGLGTFFRSGDAWVEKFYHCIMPTDDHLLGLLDDIGLSDVVSWRPTTMGLVNGEARYPFNTALDLLRYTAIPLHDRVRLGAMTLLLRRLGRGRDLDNLRTEDWLRPLFGDRLWSQFWERLFRAKFGDVVGDVPALYLWQRLGRESNASTRGYPRGGYKTLIDGLERAIRAAGGTIEMRTPVQAIQPEGDGFTIDLDGGRALAADWILSTVPMPLLRRMVVDTPLDARVPELPLPYQGVVTLAAFLSRGLEGHYWTPVLTDDVEFDGVVEMSALTGTERLGGRHLVYTMKYTDRASDLFAEDEETLAARWLEQLRHVYRDLPLIEADVEEVRIFKAPFVEPTYPLGYNSMKPPMQVPGTRLLLATTAQVYPNVTAWNSTVGLADQVVDHLRAQTDLTQPRSEALS